jgi:hypothetical protein
VLLKVVFGVVPGFAGDDGSDVTMHAMDEFAMGTFARPADLAVTQLTGH